jgi:TPR repeat protein
MKSLLLMIAVLFSANSFAGVDEADAAYDNGAYKKAAEQNKADAQFNLWMVYGKGNGTVRNYVRAHMWWNIASAQYGYTEVQYNWVSLKMK